MAGVTKVSNGSPFSAHVRGKFQITVAGPYFTESGGTGPIKFSDLRRLFKEKTSGTVTAREFRRDTSTSSTNPVVPDATPNEQISTSSNLKLSQFRGSVKRYYADSVFDGDQVHLNHFDGTNGLDFANGGTSGRDGSTVNNNLSKNVQKFVHWRNTAYSSDNDGGTGGSAESKNGTGVGKIPAMRLQPSISGGSYGVYNLQLNVSGNIYGAAGRGGYKNQTNNRDTRRGKAGGTALKIKHNGSPTVVYIENGANIHGGGGGAEQGKMGEDGVEGVCRQEVTETKVGSCGGGSPSCGPGSTKISSSTSDCGTAEENCRRVRGGGKVCDEVTLTQTTVVCLASSDEAPPNAPGWVRGVGGKGGDGAGWLDGQYRSNGRTGEVGTTNIYYPCPRGGDVPVGRKRAGDGRKGGNGGEPGKAGQYTTSKDRGGSGGAAICGNNFIVQGNKNSKTLKSRYDGSCAGETSENNKAPTTAIRLKILDEPKYVRFKALNGVTSILVTAPGNTKVDFGIKYAWDDSSDKGRHLSKFEFQGKTFERSGTKGDKFRTFSLERGEYPIIWYDLNDKNKANDNDDHPSEFKVLFNKKLRRNAMKVLGISQDNNVEDHMVLGLRDNHEDDANGAIIITDKLSDNNIRPYPPAKVRYQLTAPPTITNVTGSSTPNDPQFNLPNDSLSYSPIFGGTNSKFIREFEWRPVAKRNISYSITATGPTGTRIRGFTVT